MKRDNSFDAWKGIAIVFVVAIHAANTGKEFLCGPSEWNYFATLGLRQVYSFAVPLFFFMAGFFADKEIETITMRWRTYAAHKLTRILVPYVFWSLVVIFFLQRNFDFLHLVKSLSLGRAQGPYYFLIALSFLYIMTPIASRLGIKRETTMLVIALNLITISAIYMLRIEMKESFTWQMAALPFTTWIIFYYLGLHARKSRADSLFGHSDSLLSALGLCIFCLILSCLEALFLITNEAGPYFWASSQVKFSSFLYSISIINLFLVLRSRKIKYPAALIYLGKASFGIYLIHEIFRGKISSRLAHIENLYFIQPLFQATVVVTTIVACLIVIETTRRVFGASKAAKYFGF